MACATRDRWQARILSRDFAVAHRPCQIEHREQITQRQNRSARRGHYVKHLELGEDSCDSGAACQGTQE